ncbi:MAG: hypothetical protein ACHP79_12355, partial [Terriglobales bacterium]
FKRPHPIVRRLDRIWLMTGASKSRRERSKLKPRELRLVWMAAVATTIIAVLELFYGMALSTQ